MCTRSPANISSGYQMTEQFSNIFVSNTLSIQFTSSFQPPSLQAIPVPETSTPTRRRGKKKKTGKGSNNADD